MSRQARWVSGAVVAGWLAVVASCSSEPAGGTPGTDADATAEDGTDEEPGPVSAPPFERETVDTADFPAPEGRVWRRAIIHLHSTHSHDACDGAPRVDGEYNFPCLASLRSALCTDRIDVAYLTDHRSLMAETPFEDLLLYDPATDELVEEGGVAVANRIGCPDGFVVRTAAGIEGSDQLMALAFHGHLDEDVEVRTALLGRTDAEAIGAFRERGALLWTAHTEQSNAAQILERGCDGIEIYNLHANLAPDIREEFLGLDPVAGLEDLFHFQLRQSDTPPDLALLGFLEPSAPALASWAAALRERMVVGVGGTDAHENVLPTPLVDGERFDSYRRMMAWFSNYILADDPSLAATTEGLRAGRVFLAFDTVASPAGFDCAVVEAGGVRHEMGESLPWAEGLSLNATVPGIEAPWVEVVPIRTLLLRAADGEWETIAQSGAGDASWALEEPGVYRVEVRVTPTHLAPYLDPRLAHMAEREVAWIMGNPFRVE